MQCNRNIATKNKQYTVHTVQVHNIGTDVKCEGGFFLLYDFLVRVLFFSLVHN